MQLKIILILPALVPLAVAGASLVGSGIAAYQSRRNMKRQEKQNAQDRAFQERMYDKQRADNLSDFERANSYNDPAQQMTRLRQAGLNPNLVYGKGADTTAAQIKSSSPQGGSLPAPRNELPDQNFLSNALVAAVNTAQTMAQTDNMQKAAELNMKKSETEGIKAETGKFYLDQSKELNDSVIMKAKLQNKQIETGIEKTNTDIYKTEKDIERMSIQNQIDLDRNERERIRNAVNIKQVHQQILESKQRILESKERANAIQIRTANNGLVRDNLIQQNDILRSQKRSIDGMLELAKRKADLMDEQEYRKWVESILPF